MSQVLSGMPRLPIASAADVGVQPSTQAAACVSASPESLSNKRVSTPTPEILPSSWGVEGWGFGICLLNIMHSPGDSIAGDPKISSPD